MGEGDCRSTTVTDHVDRIEAQVDAQGFQVCCHASGRHVIWVWGTFGVVSTPGFQIDDLKVVLQGAERRLVQGDADSPSWWLDDHRSMRDRYSRSRLDGVLKGQRIMRESERPRAKFYRSHA